MSQRPHPLDHLLHQHLRAFLQEADVAALRVLQRELEWVELPAGSVLMRQGEPGDAMYVLASGRLRVNITLADGSERTVRECTRGQVVGEMALITEEPRSATLVAVRDSVLARLAKPAFAELLRQHPAVSMVLTRQIIKRLQTEGQTTRLDRPVAIALLPLGGRLDGPTAAGLAQGLVAELSQHGRVALIDSAAITARLGHAPSDDAASMRRVAVALDEIEASHDTLLLLADPAPTAWTRCCARQGDEVLLLAHADDDPVPGAVEQACGFGADGPQTLPATVLVLLHPAPRRGPTGTARWLAPRHLRAHVHLREGHAPDLARLARLVGRRGVGLVLAGGGARGAAHAGVYQALMERGVPVDAIGGTSMGAVFGALMAFDPAGPVVVERFAAHFAANPTGDFTVLPLLSIIKGQRLRGMMERTEREFGGGAGLDIADLWKPYFSIVSNYSRATEQVMRHGTLIDAVMASCAIPGALPPVLHQGELLCDGGVFNNFPVEEMRNTWGVGRVIGVDIGLAPPRPLTLDRLPTPAQLFWDRFRPRARRRYRLPSLANYLMNVTALYGTSRQRAASAQADLLLCPPLPRIGMLDWRRYRNAVKVGYDTAIQALDAPPQR